MLETRQPAPRTWNTHNETNATQEAKQRTTGAVVHNQRSAAVSFVRVSAFVSGVEQ